MKINWFKIEISELENNLPYDLIIANPYDWAITINYLKQGEWCKDCNNKYGNCWCNFCKICCITECLCNLNIHFEGHSYSDYLAEDRNKIRKKVFEFIIKNLSKKNIKLMDFKNWTNQLEEDYPMTQEDLNEIKYYENKLV